MPESSVEAKHRDEIVDGVRVVRVPIVSRGADLNGLNKLKRVANYFSFPIASWLTNAAMDRRYDCVLCMQYSPVLMALPALRIARKQGVPCLLWSFDLWPEDMLTGGLSRDGLPYRIMRRVSRSIYRRADMVAVTSPGFTAYFDEQLNLHDLKTVWLPQLAEETFERVADTAKPMSVRLFLPLQEILVEIKVSKRLSKQHRFWCMSPFTCVLSVQALA